jgi:hypothetical protein
LHSFLFAVIEKDMSRRRRVTDDEENDTDHSSDSGVEDKPEVVNDEKVIDSSIK